jgi:acyl-coenzyme A thioesterase PaaI-like protein
VSRVAIQDQYPDEFSHCYGCGRLNRHGLHIRSYWEGDEAVATFAPTAYQIAVPGFVYGGLIASLLDCHGIAAAAAAQLQAEGRTIGDGPVPRFVTAALRIDYLKPTPLGPDLEIRGRPKALQGRKVIVDVSLAAEGVLCAGGELIAAPMPESMNLGHGRP